MTDAIIVVNAGSTSLKFGAYGVQTAGSLPLLCRGQIDGMQRDPHFIAKNAAGKPRRPRMGRGQRDRSQDRAPLHHHLA